MTALVLPFSEPVPTLAEIRAEIGPLEHEWRKTLASLDRKATPDPSLVTLEAAALDAYLAACDRYSICREVACYRTTGGDYCARHRFVAD
jgi:hypothetical protein